MVSDALEEPVPAPSGRGQPILGLLDKAIGAQAPLVHKNIARARQCNPDATPAEVVRALERMYVSALAGAGAAVGATAAAPAVGTGIAVALSAGEFFSSLELSTLFVLSLAVVHRVQPDEIERRRTLVMGILLGESGSTTIGKVAERTGKHWARHLVEKEPTAQLIKINKLLGKNFVTKYGTKQGIIVRGRVVPFGIGAAIGGGANATIAALSVRAARRAFGPAPQAWSSASPDPEPFTPDSQLAPPDESLDWHRSWPTRRRLTAEVRRGVDSGMACIGGGPLWTSADPRLGRRKLQETGHRRLIRAGFRHLPPAAPRRTGPLADRRKCLPRGGRSDQWLRLDARLGAGAGTAGHRPAETDRLAVSVNFDVNCSRKSTAPSMINVREC